MKRDIDPVKIIKILPVPRPSSKPPFFDPGWWAKVRERVQAVSSSVRERLGELRGGGPVREPTVERPVGQSTEPTSISASQQIDEPPTRSGAETSVAETVSEVSASTEPEPVQRREEVVQAELRSSDDATPPTIRQPSSIDRLLTQLKLYWETERERLRGRVQDVWLSGRQRAGLYQQAATQRLAGWREDSRRLIATQRARTRARTDRTVAAVRAKVAARRASLTMRQELRAIHKLMQEQDGRLQQLATDMAAQRQALEELTKQLAAMTNRTHTAARGPSEGPGGQRGRVVKRNGGETGAQSRAAH